MNDTGICPDLGKLELGAGLQLINPIKVFLMPQISQGHHSSLSFFGPAAAKSLQSYPTLCDPIDGSPPGSTVPGILQARTVTAAAVAAMMFSSIKTNSLTKNGQKS